jgi:hypothetical protein
MRVLVVPIALVMGEAACSSSVNSDPCAFNVPQSVRDEAKSLQNTAPTIDETDLSGGAPAAPAGGTIQSGKYYLTAATFYYPSSLPASPDGDTYQDTLVVDATAKTLAEVQYQSGVYGQANGNVSQSAVYTVNGTTMTWSLDACTDMTFTQQAVISYSYTATATQLILQNTDVAEANYAAFVYTLQ